MVGRTKTEPLLSLVNKINNVETTEVHECVPFALIFLIKWSQVELLSLFSSNCTSTFAGIILLKTMFFAKRCQGNYALEPLYTQSSPATCFCKSGAKNVLKFIGLLRGGGGPMFPRVPQSSLGILKVPQLPPLLGSQQNKKLQYQEPTSHIHQWILRSIFDLQIYIALGKFCSKSFATSCVFSEPGGKKTYQTLKRAKVSRVFLEFWCLHLTSKCLESSNYNMTLTYLSK